MRRGGERAEERTKRRRGVEGREEERRAQAHSASMCKLRDLVRGKASLGRRELGLAAWGKHKRNSAAKRTR